MTSRTKKRKQRPFEPHEPPPGPEEGFQPGPSLFIQAHEADLVRGPRATDAARSLEVLFREEGGVREVEAGDGLIRWNGREGLEFVDMFSDDHVQLRGHAQDIPATSRGGPDIWVDRYDARLLLESLPNKLPPTAAGASEPGSPGGWSDLPSDAEDTFFFSAEEVEDYRREKRRRVIDRDREARLHALRAEAGEDENEKDPQEEWGGSDEEPDDAQRELIRRTASHILSSPNAAQLEMRILANHGADPRFAFLRGRWSRAWRLAKGKHRLELEAEKRKEEAGRPAGGGGMGGLTGYGDSDADEDEEDEPNKESNEATVDYSSDHNDGGEGRGLADAPQARPPPEPEPEPEPDDPVKAERRARARKWAEMRRAAKDGVVAQESNA